MNPLSSLRICILVGAAVLGCLTAPGPVAMGEERPRESGGIGALLELPPERAARFRELQERVARQNQQLEGRLRERRADLEDLYRGYRLDEERCQRLERVIRETQSQMLELHHKFQLEVRTILTEPEFERLQRKLREARERASGGPQRKVIRINPNSGRK